MLGISQGGKRMRTLELITNPTQEEGEGEGVWGGAGGDI